MGAAKDISELVEVGRCGAFMGIDKVSFPKGPTNVELADLVRDACDKGLERQLILSSDVARRTMLSRYGGKGYPTVLRDFVPMLKERGIPDATIETMLSRQPARGCSPLRMTGRDDGIDRGAALVRSSRRHARAWHVRPGSGTREPQHEPHEHDRLHPGGARRRCSRSSMSGRRRRRIAAAAAITRSL